MKLHKIVVFPFLIVILFLTGCNNEIGPVAPPLTKSSDSTTLLKVGQGGHIWSDGLLFRTIGTPANFKPSSGNFDQLYTGMFKDGVGAISESKPGDQDYNGGRWHVNALKESVNPAKYINASSVEELDLSDFVYTETYFECPLLPTK